MSNITVLMAHRFQLTGAYNLILKDDATPTGSVVTLPAGWYSHLTAGAGTGTQASPWLLISKVDGVLRTGVHTSLWNCSLASNGKVTITYRGTGSVGVISGSGSVNVAPYMLGFDTNTFGGNFTTWTSASREAPHYPYGTFAARALAPDTGWTNAAIDNAFVDTADGTSFGFTNTTFRDTRKFTINFVPRYAEYITNGASSSVCYPSKSLWANPPLSETTYSPPYTWRHFHIGNRNNPINVMWNYSTVINNVLSGTDPKGYYDTCYLTADTLNKAGNIVPQVEYWEKFCKISDVELSLTGTGSIF